MYSCLLQPVSVVDGIGPSLAQRLARQGVRLVGDLLLHLPKSYEDDRQVQAIAGLHEGQRARIEGRIIGKQAHGIGRKRQVTIRLADETGEIALLFFHSGYMLSDARLQEGRRISVRGTVRRWRGQWQMSHPEWLPAGQFVPAIRPQYSSLAGLNSRRLGNWIGQVLQRLPADAASPLDAMVSPWSTLSLRQALLGLHLPGQQTADKTQCLQRLKLEEVLVYLALMREKRRQAERRAPAMPESRLSQALQQAFSYPLTAAQQQAWQEIQHDLQGGRRMHRLLQGDVGAGKTWLAALAIVHAFDNGWQSALLAPTEVLAAQHVDTLQALLASLQCPLALLTGSTRAAERRRILAALAAGDIACIIGTHALLHEDIRFQRLGLAMVDEQHRFGVRQRWALAEHAHAGHDDAIHLLAMTATPIPRSMALALYGDMDLSLMRGMPPGRRPVQTRVLSASRMPALVAGIRRILQQQGRVYWIVPRIDEQEDGLSVEQRSELLQRYFPEAGVTGLHGRMKSRDKQARLQAFAEGHCRILVSTTVIEVGVNVLEARLIVIEQAERYGLAQLHQLRGRVGRSTEQGYCILVAGDEVGETGMARLRTMVDCHDGLELAEADLKLRGAGDALGVQQSGDAGFRIVDMVADHALIRDCFATLPDFTPDACMQYFWRPEADAID